MKLKSVEFTRTLNIGGYQAQRWSDVHGWDMDLHLETGIVGLAKAGHARVYVSPAHWGTCETSELHQDAPPPALVTVTPVEAPAPVLEAPKGLKKKVGK